MKYVMSMSKKELVEELWKSDPHIHNILKNSNHVEGARHVLFDYFNYLNRSMFNMKPDTYLSNMNIVEKINKKCVRVFSNTIRTENERLTNTSPLELLFNLAQDREGAMDQVSEAFLCEYICLLQGITGQAGEHMKSRNVFQGNEGREAALIRSKQLDKHAAYIRKYYKRYRTGLNRSVIREREAMKKAILARFSATDDDWRDYLWHLKHIIKDIDTLSSIVKLEEDEIAGIRAAVENSIPFEITPYYLSLFNREGRRDYDRGIRAQVIPSARYCAGVVENRKKGIDMDFMGEKSTSPIDGITRRYPEILILKPFNSCPQICVYCQRNWEIKCLDSYVQLSREKVSEAIAWISDHEGITEVLITGGDPLTMKNDYLDWLLGEVAKIRHVERIRIGTRIPVTMPQRIDDGLLKIFSKYHQWGKREVAIVTHFEFATEVTPEVLEAIRKIKSLGMNIYNQQVFTYYNSRRFETAFLRKTLKLSGVDPYYTFNTKGKEETIDFRVPIARIEQEQREEARLQPGLVRTDEPVFNVPRLGKSNLRAWQDHDVIMILPDGRRVYRFYSWEIRLLNTLAYLYTDVSIYDYMKRLAENGENISDYITIWYYF